MLAYNTGVSFFNISSKFVQTLFCSIRYRGAIGRLAVAWTAASIVLCIWHSEACWQMGQMFERTWTICWDL